MMVSEAQMNVTPNSPQFGHPLRPANYKILTDFSSTSVV